MSIVEYADSGFYINMSDLELEGYAVEYSNALPFPNIALEDFLSKYILDKLHSEFPGRDKIADVYFDDGYRGAKKRQIGPKQWSCFTRELIEFLNSALFCEFLERVTGIEGLIIDQHHVGGGLHETLEGGVLGIHADFRINKKLHLLRRINLIIYLNPLWEESYGGCLELWDRNMSKIEKKIIPKYGTAVIFNTDRFSYHGHPTPVSSNGISRKSIALYYYTSSRSIYDEEINNNTMYVTSKDQLLKFKYQAFILRLKEGIKDYTPPILMRYIKNRK